MTLSKFYYNNFYYKMQIERGLLNAKKCQLIYLGPHNVGCFGQMGVSANQPNLARFQKISTISCIKSKLKGGPLNEKEIVN